jgi:hypothetical protein
MQVAMRRGEARDRDRVTKADVVGARGGPPREVLFKEKRGEEG